ncbi:C40 family peptidase [Kitasatospora sp. NBC_01287]|uniref:C40 family peptidase n=1 Tax=Kitasatospora sp. NBC_01287 TaxID=2903573 RepID=UPI00224F8EEE|nr:C40 family peptidase [Kitasatospora sp. NBC_01287]MCX4748188.1 C40 family peptidase [Kitasatospora sp. NBC_01287]
MLPRRLLTAVLLTLTALATLLAVPASSLADDPPYPSAGAVSGARAEADRQAAAVAAIEARLTGARAELEQAGLVAEQAVEAYDGAQVKLARARAAVADAGTRAVAAEAARAAAAEDAAGLAAATYRLGGSPELTAINDLLNAHGPREAGERAAAVGAAGRSTREILDAATATAKAAADAARAASSATDQAQRAAAAVDQARQQAQSRLASQQARVAELGRRRERLLAQLAAARSTTVELERARQEALEAIAAQQAEAAAKAAAQAAAAQAAAQAAARQQAAQQAAAAEAAASQQAAPAAPSGPAAPPPPAAPWSEAGARAALDFARGKLGLPYVWGGEGPDGYDCSGLTMLAWRQGGRQLTHFAADQYAESTPVTYDQLRPGDLVFWTHTGRAADIYHVAIYLGDDQMIEAPRTGVPIKQASLWIMGTPDFYARP